MSTYFFKTNITSADNESQLKPHMDKLEQSHEIDRWKVNLQGANHVLEVETQKLSPEQVKHKIREAGFEAEFTRAPQS